MFAVVATCSIYPIPSLFDEMDVRKFVESLRPTYRWKQEVLRMSDAKVMSIYQQVIKEQHTYLLERS